MGRVSGAKSKSAAQWSSPRSAFLSFQLLVAAISPCVCACVRAGVRVCVCARMSPRQLLTVLRRFRPQCGSDCGFESGCHGVGAGGAVRCSPVGCDLMMGQHLLPLPAAPAACVSTQAMSTGTSGGPFHNKGYNLSLQDC